MPEGPEVEACRRDLEAWLVGRVIRDVEVVDPGVFRLRASTRPSDRDDAAAVAAPVEVPGRRVTRIARHGKRLALWFSDLPLGWIVHLGMTGHWVRGRAEGARILVVPLAGDPVAFVDPRRFGHLRRLPAEALDAALREGHGPDALDEPLDGAGLRARLPARRAVKVALLDQAAVAGVGNIHAAEALWRAGIAPQRVAAHLSPREWDALADALRQQLWTHAAPVENPTYVNLGGPNPFAIYGRGGEPCPRCASPVDRFVQTGRSTFWCPTCQPSDG